MEVAPDMPMHCRGHLLVESGPLVFPSIVPLFMSKTPRAVMPAAATTSCAPTTNPGGKVPVCGCKHQVCPSLPHPDEEYDDEEEECDEDDDDEDEWDDECPEGKKQLPVCVSNSCTSAPPDSAVIDSAKDASAATIRTPEENLWKHRRIGLEVIGGILLYTLGSFVGILTVSLVKCTCE
jgi:hypothetical protein